MFEVEYGVRGAYRISRRKFDTKDAAIAHAERWSRSNSTGHYWAEVVDHSPAGGSLVVARFNLAD